MAVGAFTDKNQQPATDEIRATIGKMLQSWHDLADHIRETYQAQDEFVFQYGKKYGWAMRFRVRKKLLTALYPTVGGFAVQIILSNEATERAKKMRLGPNVREAISRANPYPEGRWLFVLVTSKQDVTAVQRLLALKVEAAAARPASLHKCARSQRR